MLLKTKPLYIETTIACDLDTLWKHTQEPSIHEQWDLRFTEIRYLPRASGNDPQKFTYSTKIGFGINVSGIGESVATKTKENGESTSVLSFASDNRASIISKGSGYWKYIPEKNGVRFFTGYDYETRWGSFGKLFDRFVFRPLMQWATAWSFDSLKNWIERGIHPRQARKAQLTVLLSTLTLGLIWIYHGLVPKLLFTDTGELGLLERSDLFGDHARSVMSVIGIAEILFGLIVLFIPKRIVHLLSILALFGLTLGAFISNPASFTWPFNPFTLNLAAIVLSIIVLINLDALPRATNCITKQRQ